MQIYALWGFLDLLVDAFDWGKVAVPAGGITIFLITYNVSKRLAERSLAVRIGELESGLKSATDAHAAAQMTVQSLKVQQAAHAATMQSQQTHITALEKRAVEKRAELAKVFAEGKRYYEEAHRLRVVKQDHERLKQTHAAALTKITTLDDDLIGRDEKIAAIRQDLTARETQMSQAERRMRRARRLSGYIVKAKALQARPKFKPLPDRRRAIISVAALKGGVGKTTLTAHLAGALARRGYRVLLVDLDLQGSLTGLMLPTGMILTAVKKRRLVQDYLLNAMEDRAATLVDYAVRSPHSDGQPGSIHIVPASDQLAYTELNLTLGWLLKQGERDARFLLRRALHLKGANKNYDIVLLDCPPVLNISCANALAASDYVLIPTLLTAKSSERVPNLVKAVQEEHFVKNLNSQLRIMGVVANRSRYAEPRGSQLANWKVNLPQSLAVIQNQNTKLFTTIVAGDNEIESNEERFTHPKPGGRADLNFSQLVAEFIQELPDACRRT